MGQAAAMTTPGLARGLLAFTERVIVLPRRLSLTTPGVRATAPMIRGVWGAALRGMDRMAYDAVFASGEGEDKGPSYIIRPAPPDPADAPALDWILIGKAAEHDQVLLDAWRRAAEMGLGKKRRPFTLRSIRRIEPDGMPGGSDGDGAGWPLGRAQWPIEGDPATAPCRLVFPAPLRILRRKRFVENPTLKDIVVAAARRVEQALPTPLDGVFREFRPLLLELAENTPAGGWRGGRLDLVRYSASQEKELVLHGVSGWLDLPSGPGQLWPVICAAQWIHAGKGAVIGMGQLRIESLPLEH